MKKTTITILLILVYCAVFAQSKLDLPVDRIKQTTINFLHWYKINRDNLQKRPIVIGQASDTSKNNRVAIDYSALEEYLSVLKESNFVSETFISNLRYRYLEVDKGLREKPLIDYSGPIGGLEGDLIFGFEPDETLDNIAKGRFTKIRIVGDKTIVKFDISTSNQNIFILSKEGKKWKIDYFGADTSNF